MDAFLNNKNFTIKNDKKIKLKYKMYIDFNFENF